MALLQEKIHALIEPTIEDLGLMVWGVELINGKKHSTLRVYIDKEEVGVNIDDLSIASRALSALLDIEDPIEQEYDLEVSSPGFYRPLFTAEHFAIFEGHVANIHLRMPSENRRKWLGRIIEVTDTSVVIDTNVESVLNKGKKGKKGSPVVNDDEETEFEFLFSNILKANLDPDYK